MIKKCSPAVFGIALICFFLPWLDVSCSGQKVITFSGIQLATGKTIDGPTMFGQKQQKRIGGEPLAIIPLLATLAAIGLGFAKHRQGAIGPAVAGAIGALFLLLLKAKIDDTVFRESGGVLKVEYTGAFYLTLILYLAGIAIGVYPLLQGRGALAPSMGRAEKTAFCTQCGAENQGDNRYCCECGAKIENEGS